MREEISKIKQYWEERAKNAQLNPNATTDDVFLRELEIRTFIETIKKLKKKNLYILDLGCGDGYTTIRIAKELTDFRFIGIDYCKNMIANANLGLNNETDNSLRTRIEFRTADATLINKQFKNETFDIVISSRCLINLTTRKQQYNTIEKISKSLKKKGVYISIENFEEGNKELNNLRKQIGLPEIAIRWHNLFFNQKDYLKKTNKLFNNTNIINFSSAYYYSTRIIYSKFCQMKNIEPDYNHEIHKLSIDLPTFGNYSPIMLVIHKK